MKLSLLKHALNVVITALTTLAVLWLVPGARNAIQAAGLSGKDPIGWSLLTPR